MITGSRFLTDEGGYRSSPLRRAGIRVFAALISLITHQRVTDATSGFRMSARRGIELFARDYPHDYPEVEAILLLHAHRLRQREVAVTMRPRMSGRSTIGRALSAYYMAKVLLAVLVGMLRARPDGVIVLALAHAKAPPTLQRVAVIAIAVIVVAVVVELVRRRRLMERYALLWL